MKITLNNREETFAQESMTVTELLESKNMTFKMRIVKVNGKLIKREQYDNEVIRDGDNVDVIYLMSGG